MPTWLLPKISLGNYGKNTLCRIPGIWLRTHWCYVWRPWPWWVPQLYTTPTLGFTADSHQAPVGTTVLCCCILDRNRPFPAPPHPGNCVHEPSVRRHAILCDQFVWRVCPRATIFPTGAVLFLAILLPHELHLDCGPSVYALQSPGCLL